MNMHARDIGQQFLIKLLHMLMMLDMRIENSHLTATDTCANIGHTIVVANGRMLIVRISIARLRSIPHNLIGILRFATNESATGTIAFKGRHILRRCGRDLKDGQHAAVEKEDRPLRAGPE